MTAGFDFKSLLAKHDSEIADLRGDVADVKTDVGTVKANIAALDARITNSTATLDGKITLGIQAVLDRIDKKEERHGGEVKEDLITLKAEHRESMLRVERAIIDRIEKVEQRIGDTESEVAKKGKIHIPTIVAIGAFCLTLVGVAATLTKQYVDAEGRLRDKDIRYAGELIAERFKHNDEVRGLLRSRLEEGMSAAANKVAVNGERLTVLEGEVRALAKDSATRSDIAAARMDALTRWFAYLFELQTGKPFPSPTDQPRGPQSLLP